MKNIKTLIAKRAFEIFILLLVLGQFGALFKNSGTNLYSFDLFAPVFIIAALFTLNIRKIYLPKEMLLLFAFILCGLVSLFIRSSLFNGDQILQALFYPVRFLFYILSSILVLNLVRQGIFTKDYVKNTFLFFGLVFVIIGFIQLVLLPDFEILDSSLGWDPHKNRLASSFFDPNFAGAFIIITICIVALFKDKKSQVTPLEVLYFLLSFAALIFTFSRSTWLFGGIVLLLSGLLKYRKLLLISLIVFFLTYFAVPRIQTRISGITDPSDSAAFRYKSWQNAHNLIQEKPTLGWGFNLYRFAQIDAGYFDVGETGGNSGAGADSSILFAVAVSGIFGGAFFLLFFLCLLVSLYKKQQILAFSSLVGILVEAQFVNSLFYPQILFALLVLILLILYS